jgi:hypothetical protein
MWGRKNNVETSTVHDAFVTNAADMIKAKQAIREIYADAIESNPIRETLWEMRKRGMSWSTYFKYLNEAIEIGLIPVVGKSKVGGKPVSIEDILTKEDILEEIPAEFWKTNKGWYGIGP